MVGGPLWTLWTKSTVGCHRNLSLSFSNLANGKHQTLEVCRALQAKFKCSSNHQFLPSQAISYLRSWDIHWYRSSCPCPDSSPSQTWIRHLMALRDPTKKLGSLKSKGFKSLPFAVSMAVWQDGVHGVVGQGEQGGWSWRLSSNKENTSVLQGTRMPNA